MKIRKARINEINTIKQIYINAKKFMDKTGNETQWKDNYPDYEMLYDDINKGNLYIYEDNNGIIGGVFCFYIGVEITYNNIYKGKWLNENPYGVIHRIAVSQRNQGVASYCIQWCIKQHNNIRIDTHKNNIPMQKTILKNGFTFCGIIKKEDGTKRLAYQISS